MALSTTERLPYAKLPPTEADGYRLFDLFFLSRHSKDGAFSKHHLFGIFHADFLPISRHLIAEYAGRLFTRRNHAVKLNLSGQRRRAQRLQRNGAGLIVAPCAEAQHRAQRHFLFAAVLDGKFKNDVFIALRWRIILVAAALIAKIESGKRYYTFEQCKRIAMALQTSMDYLAGLTDVKDPYPQKVDEP